MPWVQYGEGTDATWVSDEEAARLAPNPERDIPAAVKEDDLNDQRAVLKVYEALCRAGLTGPQIVVALHEIYNAGVVFRQERR